MIPCILFTDCEALDFQFHVVYNAAFTDVYSPTERKETLCSQVYVCVCLFVCLFSQESIKQQQDLFVTMFIFHNSLDVCYDSLDPTYDSLVLTYDSLDLTSANPDLTNQKSLSHLFTHNVDN